MTPDGYGVDHGVETARTSGDIDRDIGSATELAGFDSYKETGLEDRVLLGDSRVTGSTGSIRAGMHRLIGLFSHSLQQSFRGGKGQHSGELTSIAVHQADAIHHDIIDQPIAGLFHHSEI
jgi:hypothetical protein